MGPPSGLVTLMFTDIEGSTRAWEEHPRDMAAALARHDEMLRREIEGAGGYVFKTVGDAFCAAFQRAPVALDVAVKVQRLVAAEPWPESTRIRVRMALHSGECEERGGDYFGPVVNRAARLEAVAHGGQVLLSRLTADLVSADLPEDVVLRDLGQHHLKDLGRPERVFQVYAEGLRAEFPPLRSLDNPALHHNLHEQVSSFVGREQELTEIRALLAKARLVTLAGPGGVGKTRLALQAAAESLDGSGDGVWFVDLAPITDPGLVAASAAQVLWVRPESGRDIIDSIVAALGDRRLLVVLDNCEQVVEAAAAVADAVTRFCPRVTVLATSREPLGIGGEHVYRVASLSIPGPEDDLAATADSEAVRLFVERAGQHKPGFALNADTFALTARICRRLDGIPLALELAAARMRSMSVRDLDTHLDRRFRLLTGGSRTALPRQQTLQALVDWSYDLLSLPERAMLARLAVFAGGFDLAAAQAVCPDGAGGGGSAGPDRVGGAGGDGPRGGEEGQIEEFEVFELLDALVDKSLVQADESAGAVRFRLLETVRDYAAAKLTQQGEDERRRVGRAHRDYYLAVALEADRHLRAPGAAEWFDRLDIELDNLRVALSECLADPDPDPGLRLAEALSEFWGFRGHGVEGAETLRAHLDRAAAQEAPTLLRGRALAAAGALLENYAADYAAAEALANQALAIAGTLGDETLAVKARYVLAMARNLQGDYRGSVDIIDEALPVARRLSDRRHAAELLSLRGRGLYDLGEDGAASFDESAALCRQAGDRRGAAVAAANIGISALYRGDLRVAARLIAEAVGVFRELGDRQLLAAGAFYGGCVAHLDAAGAPDADEASAPAPAAADDASAAAAPDNASGGARDGHGVGDAASAMFTECIEISRRIGAGRYLAYAILGLALVASRAGDGPRAATLHGVFDARFEQLGAAAEALGTRLRDADHARLRTRMGDGPFEVAYQEGRALSLDDALSLVARSG